MKKWNGAGASAIQRQLKNEIGFDGGRRQRKVAQLQQAKSINQLMKLIG